MIDLSKLPAPAVIEVIDVEAILAVRKAQLVSYYPVEEQATAAAEIALESDPRNKMLQEAAYREMILRQRINDAAQANMLAYSNDEDLDNLAAFYSVERLVTDPGQPDATPPVPATYETNTSLRSRTQMAPEGFSTAGPEGAYKFHALSASGDVRDVAIDSPTPGQVRVTVLSDDGDGVPTAALLALVDQALNHEDVRPLTDQVLTVPAEVLPFRVVARLVMLPGPTPAPVIAAAEKATRNYVQDCKLGADVTLSGLYAALHQPGVQSVQLIEPAGPVECATNQAAYCTGIDVNLAGVDE